ncbi:coatomer subunit beta-1 [Tanacetum coccineum]
MVDIIMDVLNALSSPNHDIRRKTLVIVLDLITPRNINEVVRTLQREVVKTQRRELEKDGEYRQMLIQAIHSCAVKFPKVAGTVVHMLMDFLDDSNVASAMETSKINFVKHIKVIYCITMHFLPYHRQKEASKINFIKHAKPHLH